MPDIVMPDGQPAVAEIPKIKGVHPTGSKILIETLTGRELNPTILEIPDGAEADEGSNQAYIIALGPAMPDDSGLEVGQRIYWEGRGMPVEDPRTKPGGRIRAILEIHNVKAIIEEED